MLRSVLRLFLRLFNGWKRRSRIAWNREIGAWKRTKNHPSQRHFYGVLMMLISLPIMGYVAFQTGWTVWLSYGFSSFLAFSYAVFFSKPNTFFLIYAGIIIGGVAREVLFDATGIAMAGDFLSASIVGSVGIYIMFMSKQLKSGNKPDRTASRPKRISRK